MKVRDCLVGARFIAPLVGDSWGAMNRAPWEVSITDCGGLTVIVVGARFIAPLVGDSWGAMNRAPTIISPLSWFGHHFLDHYPNAADLFECIR